MRYNFVLLNESSGNNIVARLAARGVLQILSMILMISAFVVTK